MNNIKISLFTLFILLLASFSSCTDDETYTANPTYSNSKTNTNAGSGSSSNSLVGSWDMISLDYTGTATNAGITTETSGIGKDFTYVLTFSDNPNNFASSGGYTVALTSSVAGIPFTQDVSLGNVVRTGSWSVNGNQLILVETNGDTSTTKILSQSANNFALDYAGLMGKSTNVGADIKLTSGQISFRRK